MKDKKKDELQNNVEELKNKFQTLGGENEILEMSYDEVKALKKEYKKEKAQNRKIKGVRNLKITGNVLLLTVPFVISAVVYGATFGICNSVVSIDKNDTYNQYKIISMDSNGEYSEDITNEKCNDYIKIDTGWFESDQNYVRYKYSVEHDFETQEEVESVVNSDYFELLQEYDFQLDEKLEAEKTDEREIIEKNESKIEVGAAVACTEDELEKVKSFDRGGKIFAAIMSLIPAAICCCGAYSICSDNNKKFKGKIMNAIREADKQLVGKEYLNNKKKKIKQLKK